MPNRVSVKVCDLVGLLTTKLTHTQNKLNSLTHDWKEQNTIKSFTEFRELEKSFQELFESAQKAKLLLDRRNK